MMSRLLLAFALLVCTLAGARAQSVITATSDPTVSIHSNFSGETITLFGNIESDRLTGAEPDGPYQVAIVVRGPVADRVVRHKSRQFGIVLNSDYALYQNLPSFYRVLSSAPIEAIASPDVRESELLTLESLAARTTSETSGNTEVFNEQLLRLMEEASLFRTDSRGVQFLSPTFYAARVALPANVPNGSFLAHTMVFQNGEIVAERAQRFFVQKTGFERFLGEASREQPLLYGLAVVSIAIFTGWLGGVVFRR